MSIIIQEPNNNRKMVSLIGVDKNAFSILAFVRRHMRKAGYSKAEIEEYTKRAKAGDYTHLLRVSNQQVDALNERTGAYDADEEDDTDTAL